MKNAKRTVAALLNTRHKELRNRLKYKNEPPHIYIYCRSVFPVHALQTADQNSYKRGLLGDFHRICADGIFVNYSFFPLCL